MIHQHRIAHNITLDYGTCTPTERCSSIYMTRGFTRILHLSEAARLLEQSFDRAAGVLTWRRYAIQNRMSSSRMQYIPYVNSIIYSSASKNADRGITSLSAIWGISAFCPCHSRYIDLMMLVLKGVIIPNRGHTEILLDCKMPLLPGHSELLMPGNQKARRAFLL